MLATNCVLVSGTEHEEGIRKTWKHTMAWQACRGPGSCARLQLEDLWTDVGETRNKKAPDTRNMNSIWSKDKFWKDQAGRHDLGDMKEGLWPEPTKVVQTIPIKSETRSTTSWHLLVW